MSEQIQLIGTESTASAFRARVFKPAEGVFLFHPRALERLVSEHLEPQHLEGSVPTLAYYLMPRADFLRGLETENPEALAVIEGLNLPEQVILLPTPLELRRDHAGYTRILRDYWARRFEGEVARAWQMAREANDDDALFGVEGLRRLLGSPAVSEIRDVLIHDEVIPAGIPEPLMCRAFIARVARLRYFNPGARGYVFPAIEDWRGLDRWLLDSGLDLPAPDLGARLPRLLARARPDQRCGLPARGLLLPSGLPYGGTDPDLVGHNGSADALARACGCADPPTDPPTDPQAASDATTDPTPPVWRQAMTPLEARCLEALQEGLQLPRRDWRLRLRAGMLAALAPLLRLLLRPRLPRALRRRETPTQRHGWRLALQLRLLTETMRAAQRAERRDRYAAALDYLAAVRHGVQQILAPDAALGGPVESLLEQQRGGARDALNDLLAAKWKLGPTERLDTLVRRLDEVEPDARHAHTARGLIADLQAVLLESRTTYFRLRPLRWALSFGRHRPRQILPFQSNLKALRALDAATGRLERLGWSTQEMEHCARPLAAMSRRLSQQLEQDLRPHLERALLQADFTPRTHRERVAFHKLLRELLDIIQRRRHLKFTDMRDMVSRNILRLPDLTLGELFAGDRLSRFDRSAARALPGIYKPGEIYIKGLQQLGAPLFGTPAGRLVTRYLILPFGLAFLGLKTLHVLLELLPTTAHELPIANLWSIAGTGLLINLVAYTQAGRDGATALLRGLWWGLKLLLFDGMRRLLRWRPLAMLLETNLIRGVDRFLLRPFILGGALLLPVLAVGSLLQGDLVEPGLSLLALSLAIGTLVRNTPGGRRLLDDVASRSMQLLRRLNQTLVIGLVQELMQFFKELTRRFQQGLHRIEELLSHHLGESRRRLLVKAVLAPAWLLLESLIQFYVTVLVEPQVNPIKHFPLVTIAHKVMLPFFPVITGFLAGVLDPFLPKWIAYPFVTLTILLFPGLAGFLVWELKENWKLYAANHRGLSHTDGQQPLLRRMSRDDLPEAPVEPAVVGDHGETMRGMLRRGFHSGTLPKAFDRLRRVLRQQIRDEVALPMRLREAHRHLTEVERAICVFCDRELAYSLRLRCQDPTCALARVETRRPRLATASFGLTLDLYTEAHPGDTPIRLQLSLFLLEPDLHLEARLTDANRLLGERCRARISEDVQVFSGRAGVTRMHLAID